MLISGNTVMILILGVMKKAVKWASTSINNQLEKSSLVDVDQAKAQWRRSQQKKCIFKFWKIELKKIKILKKKQKNNFYSILWSNIFYHTTGHEKCRRHRPLHFSPSTSMSMVDVDHLNSAGYTFLRSMSTAAFFSVDSRQPFSSHPIFDLFSYFRTFWTFSTY